MTDTLTRPEQGYTHNFEADSEVVDEVYYDRDTKRLFVILHNGSRAAYSGVPLEIYEEFALHHSSGQYWNRNIKRNYRGISGDVELKKRVDPFAAPKFVDSGNGVINISYGNEHNHASHHGFTNSFDRPADPAKSKWLVTIEVDAENYQNAVATAVLNANNIVAVVRK